MGFSFKLSVEKIWENFDPFPSPKKVGQNLSVFLGTSLSSRSNPQSSYVLSPAATRREVNQNYKGTFSAERQSQLRKKNWTTLPEEKFFITTWTIATENWKLYVIKHSQLKTKQILVDKILPNIICWGVIRIFLQAIWFEKGETVQSNILRPQLRGRFNKCPRLFPPHVWTNSLWIRRRLIRN